MAGTNCIALAAMFLFFDAGTAQASPVSLATCPDYFHGDAFYDNATQQCCGGYKSGAVCSLSAKCYCPSGGRVPYCNGSIACLDDPVGPATTRATTPGPATTTQAPSSAAGNRTCAAAADHWNDCGTRISDMLKDGRDYCANPFGGCNRTCCERPNTTAAPPTGSDCDALKDNWHDCRQRIQDRLDDGTDYCAVPADRASCARSCCRGNCGLTDFWKDCATRIKDRWDDGLDYCSVPFDRRGCERSCCNATQNASQKASQNASGECGAELADVRKDCEVRIRDRFLDGGDYCRDTPLGCQRSCCLQLGIPVNYVIAVMGVEYKQLKESTNLSTSFMDEVKEAIASNVKNGVQPGNVSVGVMEGSVVAEATITPPKGVSPKTIVKAIKPEMVIEVAYRVNMLSGINEARVGDLSVVASAPKVATAGNATSTNATSSSSSAITSAPRGSPTTTTATIMSAAPATSAETAAAAAAVAAALAAAAAAAFFG